MSRTSRKRRWFAYLIAPISLCASLQGMAHGFRPAQLELDAAGDGIYLVRWAPNDAAEATEFVGIDPLRVRFPEHCERTPFLGGADAEYFRLDCGDQGLEGTCLRVLGLSSSVAQAVATLRLSDGRQRSRLLGYGNDTWCIDPSSTLLSAVSSYFDAGLHHILEGADHLLFLLTLVLIFRRAALRLALITAFTIGHSLSLGIASLGWLTPPMAAIEILIAWTVVFAAYEAYQVIDRGEARAASITQRLPWLVTGGFGFVHGFGFAAALRDIGFGEGGAIVLPLASFNLGVEAGQVLVLAGVLAIERAWRWLPLARSSGTQLARVGVTMIGSVAVYWVLERGADLWRTAGA